MHQVNKHGDSRKWFTETVFKHFKSGALKTITNVAKKEYTFWVNWKKILCRCISKILLIDTEQLSKIWISSKVFFKDIFDRFGTTYLKNAFLWRHISWTLLIDFRAATYLKSGFSQKYSWKIFFRNFKTSTTKIINLKVH